MNDKLQELQDELEDTQKERDDAQDYLLTLEDDIEAGKEREGELLEALREIRQIISGLREV